VNKNVTTSPSSDKPHYPSYSCLIIAVNAETDALIHNAVIIIHRSDYASPIAIAANAQSMNPAFVSRMFVLNSGRVG
jgi:hypothetical protein